MDKGGHLAGCLMPRPASQAKRRTRFPNENKGFVQTDDNPAF
jgi:hypothetical protein